MCWRAGDGGGGRWAVISRGSVGWRGGEIVSYRALSNCPSVDIVGGTERVDN